MSSILGGSKSKSTSENKNMGIINDKFGGVADYAQEGAGGLSALLRGDMSGFNNFKNNMGYNWELNQGLGGVQQNRAAVGGLDSGATLKALANYQTGLNNQYGDTYLQGLTGLNNMGNNAGNLMANVGQYSTSSSKSGGGIGGLLGAGLSTFASGGTSISMPKSITNSKSGF